MMRRHVYTPKVDEDVKGSPYSGSNPLSDGVHAKLMELGHANCRGSFLLSDTELVILTDVDVPAGSFDAAYAAWNPSGAERKRLRSAALATVEENTEGAIYSEAVFAFDDSAFNGGGGLYTYGLQLENHRKILTLALAAVISDLTSSPWVTPPAWPAREGYSLTLGSTAAVYTFFNAAVAAATVIEATANAEIAAIHALTSNADLRAWSDSRTT